MKKYKCKIELTLQAPILTNTSDTIGFGLDMATRKYQGFPVLNGSLIRGNILHSLLYFSDCLENDPNKSESINLKKENIEKWFGKESSNRSRINFDYFWKLNTDNYKIDIKHNVRYRIGVNDKTGIVEPGNLQVIESYFETGEKPSFTGEISIWLERQPEWIKIKKWLMKSLEYISSLGALKGVGYGKLLSFKLLDEQIEEFYKCEKINVKNKKNKKKQKKNNNSLIAIPEFTNRIKFELILDKPLCVAKAHVPNSNIFVSDDYISGSIFKGAFAEQFNSFTNTLNISTGLDFENVKFTHAFPSISNNLTLPVPLSFSIAGGQLIDMALKIECCLLLKEKKVDKNKSDVEYFAPLFCSDWKNSDYDFIDKKLKEKEPEFNVFIEPQRLLTVRTAINKKNNIAAQSQLFSMECIDDSQCIKGKLNKSYEKMSWYCEVSLDKVKSDIKQKVAEEITNILLQHGLSRIGKTKANASVKNIEYYDEKSNANEKIEPVNGEFYILMLRTAARMLSSDHCVDPTNGSRQLHVKYDEYFKFISNKKLTLSHFYSQQKLFGGEFYRKHYRKNKEYLPEWLSEPGSVFVLKKTVGANHEEINKLLNDWLKNGLPVASDRADDKWETDPLIPQNGYGEIVINHSIHSSFSKPEEGELSEL